MAINIGVLFTDAVEVYETATVDEALLAAGQTVQVPISPQVGTIGGKPLYLTSALTTVKPNVPSPISPNGAAEVAPVA